MYIKTKAGIHKSIDARMVSKLVVPAAISKHIEFKIIISITSNKNSTIPTIKLFDFIIVASLH